MKKLSFLLAAIALTIMACNNVEQFRAPIEELVGNWESATTIVTDFANTLQTEQSNAAEMVAGMTIPEGVELEEETTQQVQQLQATAQTQLGSLQSLAQTVQSFVSQWTEKSSMVEELQAGLAEGKLEGDVMAKVNELKEMVGTAEGNVEDWRGQLETAKNGLQNAYVSFMELMPQEEDMTEE